MNLLSKVLQKQVFVIEDDDDMRALLQITIKALGMGVRTFADVPEFLKADALCDLYVIDLHLPGISGLVICKQIKLDEKTKNIPVIVISGNPDLGHLATQAYANDYLLKPFTSHQIAEKMQKYIL